MTKITAYLECVIQRTDYEPWLYQQEFPIANYDLFTSTETTSTLVLGVAKDPTSPFGYTMYLQQNTIGFELDTKNEVQLASLKIAWSEVSYPTTACYLCKLEQPVTLLTADLPNVNWKFLLMSVESGAYHLFLRATDNPDDPFSFGINHDCEKYKEEMLNLKEKRSSAEITKTLAVQVSLLVENCKEQLDGLTKEELLKSLGLK